MAGVSPGSPTLPAPGSPYEQQFARFLGGDHITACSFWKGRVALYALLRALGIAAGDEVIMPGFTCVVVPNAVRLAGAVPRYADIEAGGYNVDPAQVEALITPQTRALLMQHTFGIPAPIDELLAIAKRHDLLVIEDAAHVLGGEHDGQPLGTVGDAGFFSFQWSKPYTTGLGGMAVTTDPEVGARLRDVQAEAILPPPAARARLAVQYQAYARLFTPKRAWQAQSLLRSVSGAGLFVGSSSEAELEGEMPTDHGWRMAPDQERHGRKLLPRVPARNAHADAIAARYDGHMSDAGWPTPARSASASLLRYPIVVEDVEALFEAARTERVELGSWFETPLHPVAREHHERFDYTLGSCPNAERIAGKLANLPLHPRVSPEEADRTAAFVLAGARPAA